MLPFDDVIMYCWSCCQVTPWCQCPETVRWQIISFVDFVLNRGFVFLVWHKWQFLNLLRGKSLISTHLAKSYGRTLSISHLTTEISIFLCEICWHEENYDRPITVTLLWGPWRLKSPVSRWFAQPFAQAQIKKSKFRVTGLCEGNSPVNGEFPEWGPVTRKMLPFDDVIMHRT